MNRREQLHDMLCALLVSRNVYYQPPPNVSMKYPAIRYNLTAVMTKKAGDIKFIKKKKYKVILITPTVDDEAFDKILEAFEYCSFDTCYTSDGLYHYVFTLYY